MTTGLQFGCIEPGAPDGTRRTSVPLINSMSEIVLVVVPPLADWYVIDTGTW